MMTTFEPPTGMDDLTGQARTVDEERAQLAAERAQLEQERALVRQRRVIEDQPTVVTPAEREAPPAGTYGEVVDPRGEKFETDTETGELIRDGLGQPIPKWKHQTVELDGQTIQVRKPNAAALQAFAMAMSQYTPADIQMQMMTLFIKNHISPLSYQRLLAQMMSPDDEFTIEGFGKIVELIATLETGRPTGPS